MRYHPDNYYRELLRSGGRGVCPGHIDVDDGELHQRFGEIKIQYPQYADDQAIARAVYRIQTKQPAKPPEKELGPVHAVVSWPHWLKAWAIIVLILLSVMAARAQVPGLIVQVREDGTPVGTFPAFLVLDCNTDITCTVNGTIVTIDVASTGATAWSAITAGTNANALLVGTGGTFGPTGTGTITSTAFTPAGTLGNCVEWGSTGALADAGAACGTGGASFTDITTGTNTTATMTVGAGGTLTFSTTGIVNADRINGVEFTNSEGLGQIPIGQGDGTAVWADPLVQGLTAHDAAGSTTNPVAIGGYASAAAPTNVSLDGDIVRAWFLLNGSPVVNLASGGTLVTLGQKAMTASLPVVFASDQSALPVTGTFWQATQPVSGTFWQATQPVSGTFFQATQPVSAASLPLPTGAATETTLATLLTDTQLRATPVPVSGTVTANAGTGTFTNQQSNTQVDYDSGAGTQNLTVFGVALPGAGGAVAGGTAAAPLRVDPTGATTQPVSGTFWQATQPVSGTVTATGPLTDTELRATAVPVSGTFFQATQPVSAVSLPLPTGASTLAEQQTQTTALQLIDNLPVAQASTTSGQSGALIQGAVTTAAPTYTTGQTNPLSLDTGGGLRISCSSGCAGTGGTSATDDSAFTGASTPGTPIQALYDTTPPAVTDGNIGTPRMDVNRNLHVNCLVGCAGGSTTPTDDFVTPTTAGLSTSFGMVYDGATWDLMRGDSVNGTLVNLGANNDVTVTGSVTANAGTDLNTSALLTTAAHDAALGVAGTADAQVRTIQGIASMTPVVVSATNLDVQIGGSDSLTIGTFPDNEPFNVAQMNGVAVTMGNGIAGTGVQRVTLASDSTGQVAVASIAAGDNNIGNVDIVTMPAVTATNLDIRDLVPTQDDVSISGNSTGAVGTKMGYVNCDGFAFGNTSTSGSTEIVALTASDIIYVCGYVFSTSQATAVTIKLVDGTGTNCVTSPADVSAGRVYQAATSTGPIGVSVMTPGFTGMKSRASNAICINLSAAVAVAYEVWYAKF